MQATNILHPTSIRWLEVLVQIFGKTSYCANLGILMLQEYIPRSNVKRNNLLYSVIASVGSVRLKERKLVER